MGPKNFLGSVAPEPPKGLSMSVTTWTYQTRPSFHRLSLSKSPIKNYTILFKSSRIVKLDQTKPNTPYI